MSDTATTAEGLTPDGFRHEALLYASESEFLAATVPFLRQGAEAGEPTLVVVDAIKIKALRAELDGHADRVQFADMADVGLNPARIIPAWRDFVDEHGGRGRRLRGVGEPMWAGRSPDELIECQRHESLLNVAFAAGAAFWLLCPYDTAALPPAVIEEAEASHPFVCDGVGHRPSDVCRDLDAMGAPFDAPLPEPAGHAARLSFGVADLHNLRITVQERATRAGLGAPRADDLVLAVHEIAANSICHGGGRGTLRIWDTERALVCEVADHGYMDAPLVGRERPPLDTAGGRGLWLANQLCDLVQVRSFPERVVVRVHMRHGDVVASD